MDGELGARRRDDLLLLSSRKLAQNCLCDRSWRLDCQGVHEHMRGSSHGRQLARRALQLQHQAKDTREYGQLQSREMEISHQSHICLVESLAKKRLRAWCRFSVKNERVVVAEKSGSKIEKCEAVCSGCHVVPTIRFDRLPTVIIRHYVMMLLERSR